MSAGPLGAFPPALDDPADQLHPYPHLTAMLEAGPIHWEETRQCWDVVGYEAVKETLNDHERFSVAFEADPEFVMPEDGRLITGRSLLYQDPPRHDELRAVVDDWFKPGQIAPLEPVIRAMAGAYLDAAIERHGDGETATIDLVESFAYPLPVDVIAELIGVPADDRAQFREWSTLAVAASAHGGDDEPSVDAFRSGIIGYFEDLAAARREAPRDDLISKVIATESLDPDEMLGFFAILLIAGNITTTNLISNAVWTLAETDHVDTVRDDRTVLEHSIEEVIRYRSPVQTHGRVAVEDTELAGAEISAGDRLGVWIGAANRDPSVFDDPDAFIPDRRPNPHVGFGHGVHHCLGAHLARLEARVALEELLDRAASIEVDPAAMVPSGSMLVYGPSRMPVTLELA